MTPCSRVKTVPSYLYLSAPKLCFLRNSCAFCHSLDFMKVEVEQGGSNMTTGGNMTGRTGITRYDALFKSENGSY